MGFAAVAGHVVIFVAIFGAGALLAGAFNDSLSSQLDARHEFTERIKTAAGAEYEIESEAYVSGSDRTYVNLTNTGANEVHLDDVTLLLEGAVRDENDAETFRVRETPSSRIWMPGETLEIMVENEGNADLTIVDAHGIATHRRA